MSEPSDRELESALAAALAALRRRERTVAELRAWQLGRGVEGELAEAVIAELLELGELNDPRFASAFAADKRDLAGWGSERIAASLRERGIAAELVERACAEERDAELERAVRQLDARGGVGDSDAERSRALAFLTRRGYGYELAYDAIRAAGAGTPRPG